jgi:DNA-binding transcriptional LysR family regulator
MELHQIRYFVAVSRLLNFTRAAEYCDVSQPALTKAIQKLEFAMGGELIHRERQLTQLTELGKLVLPMMEGIVAQADAARMVSREYQRKDNAPLKIGLTSSVSANLLVSPLSEVARFVPGLQVEMVEESQSKLIEMIYDGDINAALTAGSEPLPERIDQWVLFDERLLVMAAPDHQWAAFQCIPIEKLVEASWLEKEECDVAQMLGKLGLGIDKIKIAHRGRHEGHLQYLVEAGLGVMLAAEHAPRLPTLIARPVEGDRLRQSIRLLVIAGRRYSPALDAFIKILRLRDWPSFQGCGEQQSGRLKSVPRSVSRDRLDSESSNVEA